MALFDAVIFDWAGTTVDYGCFAPVQAFADAFGEYGIRPTMDEIRGPMGMLKRDHVRTMLEMERISREWERVHGRAFTQEDVEQVYVLSESKILGLVGGFTDVKPYVEETVETLRTHGIRIGSTTGYTDAMMDIVVPAAAKKGYSPDCWFSPDSTGHKGRPFPYMGILEGSSAMGLSMAEYEALSPEDREHACKIVSQRFLEAGADWVVRDIRGVLELILQ